MERREKNKAMLQMVVCASLWSIAGLFIKLIPWGPLVIAGFRSLVAGFVIFTYMRIKDMKVRFTRSSLLSMVFLSATMLLFVSATKLTTSANAVVLQFTSPVFILIMSAVFLKKRINGPDVLVVILTMFGIVLFFIDDLGSGNALGNTIAVISGLTMGVMYISVGEGETEEKLSGICLGQLLTAVIGIPFIIGTDFHLELMPVVYILILGIFQLGIPYVLLGLASKNCPPLACSLIGVLEPLFNPLWVFLATGEAPGITALIGGVIIIASISVWCVYNDKKTQKVRS